MKNYVEGALSRIGLSGSPKNDQVKCTILDTLFEGKDEYESITEEIRDIGLHETIDSVVGQYDSLTTDGEFGRADSDPTDACYSLVRKYKPSTVVETGVCNGVSTLFLLQALSKDGQGHLHSIDLPYRADEDLQDFRDSTFDKYGGAAIPSDKEPGWIIPDELRRNWTLSLGKSQLKLPPLLEELENVDLFIHDSKHSHPCMMFEYEIAWHKMETGGIIVSDDISWNQAFYVFCETRNPIWGTINFDVGFMVKP